MLRVDISVTSENSGSTLITPSDSEQLFLLTHDTTNPPHKIMKYEPYHGRVRICYFCRKHDEKYATKIQGSIDPRALIKAGNFITVMYFPGLVKRQKLDLWTINIVQNKDLVDYCACIP